MYASLGRRFLAQVVDGFVGFGVYFFVGMALAPRFGGTTEDGFKLTGRPALLVLTTVGVILLVYFIFAEATRGATLGKLAAGIRVQTVTGGRISLGAAIIRNVLRIIDGIAVYLVAAISIMVTRRRQRLGDLAADTVVVDRPTRGRQRVLALVIALAVLVAGVAAGKGLG
jgi:uncharacterized RDD family membrane protein YckC